MASGKGRVRVGCCGFRSAREAYYELLESVEVQHPFYQPPLVPTLRRWREEAPEGFEFTLKAWQLVTHLSSSPTYRRLKRPLIEEQRAGAGFFRPTEAVREAGELTRECPRALKAKPVLFQCPASFKPTSENVENLRRFFRETERGRLVLAWGGRGGGARGRGQQEA